MKKEKKEKINFKESKFYKGFRRITSLGLAGALAIIFPNEIVAWLSAGAGILYGKGIIGFALMSTIVTFLGSAAGLLVQKAVLCGLTFIFSNVILKQGRKLVNFISTKIKAHRAKRKGIKLGKNITPKKVETPTVEKKVETPTVEKKIETPKVEAPKKAATPAPIDDAYDIPLEMGSRARTLGVHPSMRRR